MDDYREYVGNAHVHSVYSDGEGTYGEIAAAASAAKLNFVIVTDHNVRPEGLQGYRQQSGVGHGQVLMLTGQELHNVLAQPQANHLLVYGAERDLAPYTFGRTQTLIESARRLGGICYIAHPIERSGLRRILHPHRPELPPIPWTHWPPDGVHGIELWNYMSEFKGLLWNKLAALIYALKPQWGIRGPYRATLRLWDELLDQGYRISALGGADAHAISYTMGPIKRCIFPYAHLFRCVNTHILTKSTLTGDVETDKALVYEALGAGRTWVGYDLPHSTRGFRCLAQSGSATAVPGEELRRLGAITITISLPASGEIRLLRDGHVIQKTKGQTLKYTSVEAGVYRVEVYRRFAGHKVGWIFASPIYAI
jgi:hypothetical protein